MGIRVPRLLVLQTACIAAAYLALAGPAHAQGNPALELVQRYAPVVRLVDQPEPCKHGEPFDPIDVDLVLDNREVALHGPWSTSYIVQIAPTGKDLSTGLFGYHLDFPGHALDPGCTYETWSKQLEAGTKPRTYARVVGEQGKPGQLALQYWFFYVYNDWNDKHEGDWEMIQLDFRAASASEALSRKPYEVGYSQHTGAERADWGADKLQLVDGTHPVVYPALGSHANYFTSNLHLGRSAAEGVGCDDTSGPSRQLRPDVTLVPTDGYLTGFPWLGYQGGWGEDHPGFYGGPTGPNTKTQWTTPITWASEEWRDSSFAIPAGSSRNTATDFFCGAVAAGSTVLTKLVANPTAVVITIAVLILLLLWLGSRTRWDLSTPFRVGRRRPWGSLVTTSFDLYKSRPLLFLGIGVLFVPLGILIAGLQFLIFRIGGLDPLVDSAGETNGFVATLVFAMGLFFTIFGLNIVQAATAVALNELDQGREVTPRAAYKAILPRLPRLLLALLGAVIVITVLSLTGFGLVVGAYLLVRWSLLPQVVILGDWTPHPLRRSALLVRGHWWRVASITAFVTIPAVLIGPIVATLLLLLTSASFNVVNLIAALVDTITLPFAALVVTYLYFDVLVRGRVEKEQPAADGMLPAEI
jgi:hypothetical protein